MPDATAALVRFLIDTRWEDVPAAVQQHATRSILNFVGTALGGSHDPAIERAVAVLGPFSGPPEATVIGRRERFDALTAAFLNGASGNVFDFDDTHMPTVIHPTSPIAPALLAMAERMPVTGVQLLRAFTLGVEVACRVGNAVTPWHYAHGWHITSTCGAVGAAAAAGTLLGLDATRMTWALGLGANQACGLVESLGSMAKSVSVGNAPRSGIVAALLAREGFTAAPRTLEGERGFIHVMGRDPDLTRLTDGLGATWELANNDLKPYPCGVVLAPVIDACLELRERHPLTAERIRRVVVKGAPLLQQRADRPRPGSGREAAVSAQHTGAAVFLFGAAGIRQYTDACVADAAVQAFGERVSVVVDTAIPVEAAAVTVETVDGATYTAYVPHARGSRARPMADAEVDAKVRDLAAFGAPACDADRVIEAVRALPGAPDAAAFLALTRSP